MEKTELIDTAAESSARYATHIRKHIRLIRAEVLNKLGNHPCEGAHCGPCLAAAALRDRLSLLDRLTDQMMPLPGPLWIAYDAVARTFRVWFSDPEKPVPDNEAFYHPVKIRAPGPPNVWSGDKPATATVRFTNSEGRPHWLTVIRRVDVEGRVIAPRVNVFLDRPQYDSVLGIFTGFADSWEISPRLRGYWPAPAMVEARLSPTPPLSYDGEGYTYLGPARLMELTPQVCHRCVLNLTTDHEKTGIDSYMPCCTSCLEGAK